MGEMAQLPIMKEPPQNDHGIISHGQNGTASSQNREESAEGGSGTNLQHSIIRPALLYSSRLAVRSDERHPSLLCRSDASIPHLLPHVPRLLHVVTACMRLQPDTPRDDVWPKLVLAELLPLPGKNPVDKSKYVAVFVCFCMCLCLCMCISVKV